MRDINELCGEEVKHCCMVREMLIRTYLRRVILTQQVYNGLRQNSPRLVKLCGEVNPGTEVKSSGNTMKVVLVTDMTHATRGFSVSYTSNEDSGKLCV